MTMSEWTLGVWRVPSVRVLSARKMAANRCVREMRTDASMKAYSNSGFLPMSWAWRKSTF